MLSNDVRFNIIIPYRETDTRKEIFNFIYNRYLEWFPNIDIILCDSGSEVFNLSASRNIGMKKSFENGANVAFVSDADTICSYENIINSISIANESKRVCNPYSDFYFLNKDGTNLFMNNKDGFKSNANFHLKKEDVVDNVIRNIYPCSSLLAIPDTVFNDTGGYDENFIGWAPEDFDFFLTHIEFYQEPFLYIPGDAFSLYHSPASREHFDSGNSYYKTKKRNLGKFVLSE